MQHEIVRITKGPNGLYYLMEDESEMQAFKEFKVIKDGSPKKHKYVTIPLESFRNIITSGAKSTHSESHQRSGIGSIPIRQPKNENKKRKQIYSSSQ
jgi:hypothetical protein